MRNSYVHEETWKNINYLIHGFQIKCFLSIYKIFSSNTKSGTKEFRSHCELYGTLMAPREHNDEQWALTGSPGQAVKDVSKFIQICYSIFKMGIK